MKKNQVILDERPVDQNIEFLKALYATEDLQRPRKHFDKLGGGLFERNRDPDMTLDTFVESMQSNLD
jgi:hypothetical protein